MPGKPRTTGHRPRLRPLRSWSTLALWLFTTAAPASEQEARPNASSKGPNARETEARIKVAYIYNFLKFIEWPQGERSAAFSICLLGDDPIRTVLGELSVRTVKNRPIQVAQIKDHKALTDCHVLYVSRAEEHRVPQILQSARDAPVLSVSDIREFTAKGGMIGFVTESEHVKLEVNLKALRRAGLKASAKLLEIARVTP